MKQLFGVDLTEAEETLFPDAKPGTVLILDADGACYRAAATAKKIDTVFSRFCQEVLTDKFLTRAEYVEAHITLAGGAKADRDKYPTLRPYQANRSGKAKPPLLEPLRNMLAEGRHALPDGVELIAHHYWEADDGVTMSSYRQGKNGVVKSDDKDLRMTPHPYFEKGLAKVFTLPEGDRFGWIDDDYTPSLKLKVRGHGTKFFWAQMLMGDKADNIRGLDRLKGKLVGEAGTLDFLGPIDDENEAANRILWEYARTKQDALAEAQVLWMRRNEDDCAYKYLCELDLDADLRRWIDGLHTYHQAILKEARHE